MPKYEKKTDNPNMGRPKISIDKTQFENLCSYQCTLVEISGFFNCSEDTILNWCKETYDLTFADAFKIFSYKGKVSLRRYQFKMAEKSAAMAIFLGKQYLGQTDKQEVDFKDSATVPTFGETLLRKKDEKTGG